MTNTLLEARIAALRASVDHLQGLVAPLDDAALGGRAYAAEWTIADECSHIGSSAVIGRRRLEGVVADDPMPDDFAPSVWALWNAKSPRQKADDGLEADATLMARLASFSAEEQARVQLPMGPLTLDFAGMVGMRLNEHVLHTWDIAVALDPTATVPADAATLIVDNLELIARFSGKPTGEERTIVVGTTDPVRIFTVSVNPEAVVLAAGGLAPEVTMPAEAFVRLVYGRLDAAHTPAVEGNTDTVATLRGIFKGV